MLEFPGISGMLAAGGFSLVARVGRTLPAKLPACGLPPRKNIAVKYEANKVKAG
jgi:hypothetical protein